MDQCVETHHRIKRCRLVFPRDHVSQLEVGFGHQLTSARDLHCGDVNSEHVEVPVGEELGRGNPGAASKIEDSRARPYQFRQVIDPSLVAIRTFVASRIGPTFIVTVRTRDRVVATAHKVAPSRSRVPSCVRRHVSRFC
jgi:hypothetical protein